MLAFCKEWFVAPDGLDCKAISGTLHLVTEAGKAVGFTPTRGPIVCREAALNNSHFKTQINLGGLNVYGRNSILGSIK